MSLIPAKTLEVIDDTATGQHNANPLQALISNTLRRTERDEIFRIFWAWTAAFFLMEPIVSLLMIPNKNRRPITMAGLMLDYTYGSITFLNTVYIFKHIFKRPAYFPTTVTDLPLFIAIHATIQFVFDAIWLAATGKISWNFPLKDLLQRYDRVQKISHSVHMVTYGVVWVNVAYFFYNYLRPLEWISTIIGSAFLMLLLDR